MLRPLVIAFGALFVLCAIAGAFAFPSAWPVAAEIGGLGVVLMIGTLLKRRYRTRKGDAAGFEQTGERQYVAID